MQTSIFSSGKKIPQPHQLSLDDFKVSSPSKPTESKRLVGGIADRMHAIATNETKFHSESSEIGQNTFSLKISYMGRSYALRGIYRLDQVRSFSDMSFYSTVVNVTRFEAVNTFRDGRYVSAFLPEREYKHLTGEAVKILSSPFHNPMMQS